jgi:hypothetical protein
MGDDHHLVQSRRHAIPPEEPGRRKDHEPFLLMQPEVGVLQELEARREQRGRLGRPRSGRKHLLFGRAQEVLEADRVLERFRHCSMGRQVDRDRGRRDRSRQRCEVVERESGHDRSPSLLARGEQRDACGHITVVPVRSQARHRTLTLGVRDELGQVG